VFQNGQSDFKRNYVILFRKWRNASG